MALPFDDATLRTVLAIGNPVSLMRSSIRLMMPAACCVVLISCAKPAPAPVLYDDGARGQALEAQREAAAVADRDQALDLLRLSSMALAGGDRAEAEAALRKAVAKMTTFQADGEFAARLAAEDRKEWKGEPYEKMAAFTTLGMLLWTGGDPGNALAMFKSAVLADTGSRQEAFRSDFLPGWVLQALVYAEEGERDNAVSAMERGIDAWWSRHTVLELTRAVERARPGALPVEARDAARAAVLAGLSAGVARQPRDAGGAARATLALLPDLLRVQEALPRKERLPTLQGFRGGDFDLARRALDPFGAAWVEAVAERDAALAAEGDAWGAQAMGLLDASPKLVLLVERGSGPRKVRAGEYGELLRIVPGVRPATRPQVVVDGEAVVPLYLDETGFQASTRGGRRVDAFLKGKAVYKDASLISGYVALRVADLAFLTDNDQLGAIAAIAGGAVLISGLVTNPAADVRAWEHAPGGWYLVATPATPGPHTVEVGPRTYTVEVPERGSAVHLLPRLRPGGERSL